ncbi:E3 ubiquitin-protein ligase RNF8 isoform X2 [Anabrus simplex]|uniref:E3 ubiquitin-protein ligase RNF8 isoform X2 n=1 Tax=Anabrus simplex TaxID=316456 RepID=UPI0035A2CD08
MEAEQAVLIGLTGQCRGRRVDINSRKFDIGRSATSSMTVIHLSVSRTHCILVYDGKEWSLCDKSQFGTFVNGKRLEKDKSCYIYNGDKIQLGPSNDFIFMFTIEKDPYSDLHVSKKLRTLENRDSDLEAKCYELKHQIAVAQQKIADSYDATIAERDIKKLQLDDKLQQVQLENTRLEKLKAELEQSREKQLGELKERHNQQREEFFSQSLISADEETEALEVRMKEEFQVLESRLNTQIEELQEEIVKSKSKEQELLEANKNLLAKLEQEREEFQKRLQNDQKQLEETLGKLESQRLILQQEKLEAEMNLKNQIENLEKKYEADTTKLQDELCSQQEKIQQEKQELETRMADEKELAQKRMQEEREKLEQKLKEMQDRLNEKERAEMEMCKMLKEKEEERLRDLKRMQEEQDAQTKNLLHEVSTREQAMRSMLENEIMLLRQEKIKIENSIKSERSKIEGESAENLKQLQDELEKVKRDLCNTEGKKQILEKELEETNKAKEDASASCLKTKQDVLDKFGNLVEMELQCSICSELFVTATTLNCTHTFCRYCITEWKKKKKDCPICRTRISSETRSIVLDNFIDKMVANLSEELKHHRQAVVEERQGPSSQPSTSKSRR